MKQIFIIFSISLGIVSLAISQRDEITSEEVFALKKKLTETSEKTISISCNFSLEKHIAMIAEPMISKGKFYYSSPDKIRWEEIDPHYYLLILAGKNVYSSNEARVKNARHLAGIRELMLGSVRGELIESDLFEKKFFRQNDQIVVELYPTNGNLKKAFNSIALSFSEKNFRLAKISLNEDSGDYTTIEFTNTVFDKPLDAALFMSPPKQE